MKDGLGNERNDKNDEEKYVYTDSCMRSSGTPFHYGNSLLGAIVAPRVVMRATKGRWNKAVSEIVTIKSALDMYAVDNGEYPTTEQGLEALIRKPTLPPVSENWAGPYVKPTDFIDPWGNKYTYECPSSHEGYDYDLYSYGADGQVGGTGVNADITNWLEEEVY